jgi:hypothetical protein
MNNLDAPNPEDHFRSKMSEANLELLRELKKDPMSELLLHDQIKAMQELGSDPEAEKDEHE